MNNKLLIYILIILGFGYFNAQSQTANDASELILFTDRDFCVSGDTLWFKVWLPESTKQKGNVIRVYLDGKENNLISNVIKKTEDGWAQGFINVPDSLSTGQYFVTAFINSQRNFPDLGIESKSLMVYNRFEESVSEMEIIKSVEREEIIYYCNRIKIETDKNEYLTRDKVSVNLSFDPETEIQNAVVKAALVDPLAKEFGGNYKFSLISSNSEIPDIVENDGFLLSGKVKDAEGKPQKGILVVLSITGEPPYLDYYLSGTEGDFHFFLKEAVGSTNIIIQAISENRKEYFIEQELNYLERKTDVITESRILTSDQSKFISLLINGNFINKLFKPLNVEQPDFFEMPVRFEMPFYGPPTRRVIPDEFYDLPDFKEISRELLHGVQFRERDGIITFRMINDSRRVFFDNEPLRLLNGVPVFKNILLAKLDSKDISYVDIIQKERIFGDLTFNGILAVSLYDKSNNWMVRQPNVFQFNLNCFQPDKSPGYLSQNKFYKNQPAIRQTYYWQILQAKSNNKIEFSLSDLKGEVEISVEGVTKNNESFHASKIIEVK